jgi:hypothetical protein
MASGGAVRYRLEELQDDARRPLLAIALSGVPLRTELVAAVCRGDGGEAEAMLFTLEQRGLAIRTRDGWLPAHDEIASLLMDVTPEARVCEVHGALGQALLAAGTYEPPLLARAGRHLYRSGDRALVRKGLIQWVVAQRRNGDPRRLTELAEEFLDLDPRSENVTSLVRDLPVHVRFGITAPRLALTAALLAAMVLGAAGALRRNEPEAEAFFIAVGPGGGDTAVAYQLPIGEDMLDKTGGPLSLKSDGFRLPIALRTWNMHSAPVRSPVRESWLVDRNVADSGTIDIFLVERDGRETRLTFSPGDDHLPSWAPDGSAFVFRTARWDPRSWYDLAVMELRSRQVRPLIRHRDQRFNHPQWSPDGTRIAFVQEFPARPGSRRPCWINVDGTGLECSEERASVVAWYDRHRLVLLASEPAESRLVLLDLRTRRVQVVPLPVDPREDHVAAFGRWIAVSDEAPEGQSWFVSSLDRPLTRRELRLPFAVGPAARVSLSTAPGTAPVFLQELRITRPDVPIPATGLQRMEALAVTSLGDTIRETAVTWRSLDPEVVTFAEGGFAVPRKAGSARITASAGGWRLDTAVVDVAEPSWGLAFQETWEAGLNPRWAPFGSPKPVVVTVHGRAVLSNQGDESFVSGAYSLSALAAHDGFGLEIDLSATVTDKQWQSLTVGLYALDDKQLGTWDHSTGPLPGVLELPTSACAVDFPYAALGSVIQMRAGGESQVARVGEGLLRGRWFKVTLQVLPGGICAAAVDGVPVAYGRQPLTASLPYRVVLYGQSVGTVTLHGPLRVWRGVRGDIDWRSLLANPEGRAR